MVLPTSHNNRAFPPTKGELRLSNHVDPLQGVMPTWFLFDDHESTGREITEVLDQTRGR